MSFILKLHDSLPSLKGTYDSPASMAAITPTGDVLGTE